jgi:hypothetical protein
MTKETMKNDYEFIGMLKQYLKRKQFLMLKGLGFTAKEVEDL